MSNPWTADALLSGNDTHIELADDDAIEAMVSELHDEWVTSCPRFEDGNIQIDSLNAWVCERLNVSLSSVRPEDLHVQTEKRIKQLKLLYEEVKKRSLEGLVQDQVTQIAKIIRESRNTVQASAILYNQLDTHSSFAVDKCWNPDSFFQYTTEDEKATPFQKLIVAVLRRLSVAGLRRLDEDCYQQILLPNGETTHAWERKCSIKDFIYLNIQKETDYEEWKWLTNPHDNGEKVVHHLVTSCTQLEFPTIQMNRYLWAYNNGLYNVKEDMFYPFAMPRIVHLSDVNIDAVRSKAKAHVLDAADDSIDDSTATVVTEDGVMVWNLDEKDNTRLIADTFFKIGDDVYLNHCGREEWAEMAYAMQTYRRGMHFGDIDSVTEELVDELPSIELQQPPNIDVQPIVKANWKKEAAEP